MTGRSLARSVVETVTIACAAEEGVPRALSSRSLRPSWAMRDTAAPRAIGMPLDFYARIEVAPASISTIRLDDGTLRVLALNERPRLGP
ncbi:MAG: hypothetical protein ACREE4_14590 [Stellaceae bacterium]